MKIIFRATVIAFLFILPIQSSILCKDSIASTNSMEIVKRKINYPVLPTDHLINLSQLSAKARKAALQVQQWSNSDDLVWIAIYREGKENYVFYTRGQNQFLIFRTNPEKGGDHTIPKGKFFAVNDTMLEKIITKQTYKGTYRFNSTENGSYSEKYVTPLIEVDQKGYELPNQSNQLYWALHSPPYTGNVPSEELSTPGNSCIRLKIDVAKFIQHSVALELLVNQNTDFNIYLTRYDPKEYR